MSSNRARGQYFLVLVAAIIVVTFTVRIAEAWNAQENFWAMLIRAYYTPLH